jgi:DNA-binding NtrC family response regulator
MAKVPQILIVDDERSILLALEAGLSLSGFGVTCVRSGNEAVELANERHFDAIVCDIFMPDGDGLSVVRELRAGHQSAPIILMTAQGSVELAVQALSEGATDFIAKPFEVTTMAALLRRYIDAHRESQSAGSETDSMFSDFSRSGLVGRSPAMIEVYKLIAHAARSDATALIIGESGTGKELVARAIHDFSDRSGKPFIAVNCSGLTDTLLESELFGHTKGSFTGASTDRAGLFEAANGGTLFLDELGSTSAAFQASLLRALQSGEVRRVGATVTRRIDVRVIGASNADLRDLIEDRSFRADLYYRLSVLTIELPPLRDRGADVELLALHFLRKLSGDGQPPARLTREATDALRAYSFPGNVRELENALTRAMALASNRLITIECLPPQIAGSCARYKASTDARDIEAGIIADRPMMDELQRRYLQLILEESGGNRRRAAQVLGLDRRTIQRLVARYRLSSALEEAGSESDETDPSDPIDCETNDDTHTLM